MKIRLENFRCYEDKTFDFGEKGLSLLSGPSGKGKCLGKDTLVMLYDGTTKKVQDIRRGDELMGDDSTKRLVITTCEGIDELFRVVPMYGDSYVVNSAHILTLRDFSEPYDIPIKKFMKLPINEQNIASTYHTRVCFSYKKLDINPYFIGVWLGTLNNTCKYVTMKKSVVSFFVTTIYPFFRNETKTIYKIDPFTSKLLEAFVFHEYKTSSFEQRFEILAGVIDVSGYINNNKIIINNNVKFLEDIKYIALSVGLMSYLNSNGELVIYGKDTVYIPTNINIPMRTQIHNSINQPFTIVPEGKGEYYGFKVNKNGRFLLGDFKVTHNSTILMGIYFALFGTGTKLQTYGKKSCKVELDFDGMTIMRSKGPNRLLVNGIYEDKTGQNIINKMFGNTFKATSYIAQNALNSFVLMSPIEKLSFLEKFAFNDVDLSQIKARNKAVISKRNEHLIGIVSKLDMAKTVLKELEQPSEVRFPLKCTKKGRTIAIKNERTRLKNCGIMMKRNFVQIKRKETEINAIRVLTVVSDREELEKHLFAKEKDSVLLESMKTVSEKNVPLKELESNLKYILDNKKLQSLLERYSIDNEKLLEMQTSEMNVITSNADKIREKLYKEYSQDELNTQIEITKAFLKDAKLLEELEDEKWRWNCTEESYGKQLEYEKHKNLGNNDELYKYASIEQKLDISSKELKTYNDLLEKLKKQKDVHACPSCKTSVRFYGNKLIINEGKCEKSSHTIDECKAAIKKLKNQTTFLQRKYVELQMYEKKSKEIQIQIEDINNSYEEPLDKKELMCELGQLKEYRIEQRILKKKLDKLDEHKKNQVYSESLKSMGCDVFVMKQDIEKLVNSTDKNNKHEIKMNEEELRTSIYTRKRVIDKIEAFTKSLNSIKTSIIYIENKINNAKITHVNKYKIIRKISDIESVIDTLKQNNKDLVVKQQGHKDTLKIVDDWVIYNEKMDNYRLWEDKVTKINIDEKEARNMYASSTMLRDKILEAESLAMRHVIESINTHARIYLNCFFPEYPISVHLLPFKETKKSTKPRINIEIEYKGMECDLNMLSGGELSRVILAYTLALAEMFNSPLLLLDECTASLDQDMTGIVFNGIKEHFNGKLTLIIAHQIITGTFDTVIKLDDE